MPVKVKIKGNSTPVTHAGAGSFQVRDGSLHVVRNHSDPTPVAVYAAGAWDHATVLDGEKN